MAEIKGKFIQLASSFLKTNPAIHQVAHEIVASMAGIRPNQLDPEEFYDTKILDAIFQSIRVNEDELGAWI